MAAASKKFCQNLPKIELHAHLNGSMSDSTLDRLLKEKHRDITLEQLTIKGGETKTLEDIFSKFHQIHQVSDNAEAIYQIACDVIREFHDDKVCYLELRSTPRNVASTGMTKRNYFEAVLKAIEDQSKAIPDIIVRYLPSIDRCQSKQNIIDTISLADEYRRRSNGVIVGIDLSGNPKAGDSKELCPLLLSARERGFKLAVHLGEICNPEDTMDLLKLLPDRVGHGTWLHPEVGGSQEMLQLMLQHKIPMELCLSSNVKGQTVTGYENHHFQYWYQHGQPLTFATDDKGVFSTSLSEEFHIASQTFNLSPEQLWLISLQSVDYIFDTDDVKMQLIDKWFSPLQKENIFSHCNV